MIAVSSSAVFTTVHEEMRRGGEGLRSAVRYSLGVVGVSWKAMLLWILLLDAPLLGWEKLSRIRGKEMM